MRLNPELADRIVANLAEQLPEGIRIKRRRATLEVSSAAARFERSYSSGATFRHLSDAQGTRAVAEAMKAALVMVNSHLRSEGRTWPGLAAGDWRVLVDRVGDEVRASVRDKGGQELRFAPLNVPPATSADKHEPPKATDPALPAQLLAGAPPIDNVPLWLLRVGIDHSGQVSFTQPWDIAIRTAVLCQLRLSGRITETDDRMEVDTEDSGVLYEDLACRQLLAQRAPTEASWIRTGRLRAVDVATALITSGEWSQHWRPLSPGRHQYRALKQQYIPLRRRLAPTYDGEFGPVSDSEAAVAVLGHALNVVRPKRIGGRSDESDEPLQPYECGLLDQLVSTAVAEINGLAAASRANANPTW